MKLIAKLVLAAVLWAEREASPPELPALQLLVHLTAQRLELQALSGRSATPSLYEVGEPGLEPPPLWTSTAAPVEETASTGETPAVEGGIAAAAAQEIPVPPAEIEIAAPEPEPELAAASAPAEATAPAAPFETDAELEASALEFEEIREEPPSGAATVVAPPAAPDYEPSPEFELEEMAPEPLEESLPSPAPPIDALGTVRLARPELLAPLREEQTAPLPIPPPVAAEPPPPAPEASTGAPAAPPEEADLTEDATVLTLRRPEWATPPAPPMPPTPSVTPPPTEEPLERTASRTRTTEVAPPPDVRGPGLAFAGARGPRSSEQPLHEEAKRLARLLISEIKLYNEEQVMEGRRNRDLYHRLRDDIDRSRQIYDERVDAAVRGESDYFQQELVRSLAGGDPRALGI